MGAVGGVSMVGVGHVLGLIVGTGVGFAKVLLVMVTDNKPT